MCMRGEFWNNSWVMKCVTVVLCVVAIATVPGRWCCSSGWSGSETSWTGRQKQEEVCISIVCVWEGLRGGGGGEFKMNMYILFVGRGISPCIY